MCRRAGTGLRIRRHLEIDLHLCIFLLRADKWKTTGIGSQISDGKVIAVDVDNDGGGDCRNLVLLEDAYVVQCDQRSNVDETPG